MLQLEAIGNLGADATIGEALGLFIPKVEGPDIEIIGRAADTLGYSTNKL